MIPAPILPEHYAHLAGEPELAEAWDQEVRLRQAEAAKLGMLLAYRSRKLQTHRDQHAFARAAVEKAVVRDAAIILSATESSVRRLLTSAEFLQKKLPRTWVACGAGSMDFGRARRVAQAAEDIAHRDDLLPILDEEVIQKAPAMNLAEVDQWVKQRIPELDAEAYNSRCERARAKRYVAFTHHDDGMTKIDALVPTVSVASLERELWSSARKQTDESAEGDRTFTQRMADEFTSRLQRGTTEQREAERDLQQPAPVNAKISILVTADTLAGRSNAPALSEDKSYVLPASDVRRIARDPRATHEWFASGTTSGPDGEEQITSVVPLSTGYPSNGWDEVSAWERSVNALSKTSQARFVTGQLREAILIRDRTCRADGCTRPAWAADVDHKTPHEQGGRTAPENIWALCRDHHIMKSHGLLPFPGHDPPEGDLPGRVLEHESNESG